MTGSSPGQVAQVLDYGHFFCRDCEKKLVGNPKNLASILHIDRISAT